MRLSTLFATALTAFSIAACSGATPYPGTPQAFESACDPSNQGQVIAVEGYLRLPHAIESPSSVILDLYRDRTFSEKPIGVDMRFGDGVDQVQRITTAYHDSDLKVRMADGTLAPFLTRVRISGRVTFPPASGGHDCTLESPYVELAK